MGERHLTPEQLADRLGLSKATLAMWRVRGEGPRFLKFGRTQQARVRYPESAIEEWEIGSLRSNTGQIFGA